MLHPTKLPTIRRAEIRATRYVAILGGGPAVRIKRPTGTSEERHGPARAIVFGRKPGPEPLSNELSPFGGRATTRAAAEAAPPASVWLDPPHGLSSFTGAARRRGVVFSRRGSPAPTHLAMPERRRSPHTLFSSIIRGSLRGTRKPRRATSRLPPRDAQEHTYTALHAIPQLRLASGLPADRRGHATAAAGGHGQVGGDPAGRVTARSCRIRPRCFAETGHA